jgi:protein phosphatase 4 regulatory subunit 3
MVRFEQNNEPVPPPQQNVEAEASTTRLREEEDSYFNHSDEEETVKIKPSPRKKRKDTPKKISMFVAREKPALGLDYDDGSDSEGSAGTQSPRMRPNDQLENELGDVEMKMKAKREANDEEEEELLVMPPKEETGKRPGTPVKPDTVAKRIKVMGQWGRK